MSDCVKHVGWVYPWYYSQEMLSLYIHFDVLIGNGRHAYMLCGWLIKKCLIQVPATHLHLLGEVICIYLPQNYVHFSMPWLNVHDPMHSVSVVVCTTF